MRGLTFISQMVILHGVKKKIHHERLRALDFRETA